MEGWWLGQTLPDIPRIHTAITEWLACMIFIFGTRRRFTGWKFRVIAVVALMLQSCFLVVTAGFDGGLWILCMVVVVFLMYIFIYICCDIDVISTGYYCVNAFVLAEFTASLEWQIYCFITYNNSIVGAWVEPVILVISYMGICTVMWSVFRHFRIQTHQPDVMLRELIFATIIGFSVFLISNIGFVYSNTPFSGNFSGEIFTIRTLVDLGGVAILYAYYIQRVNLRAQYELKNMEMIADNIGFFKSPVFPVFMRCRVFLLPCFTPRLTPI